MSDPPNKSPNPTRRRLLQTLGAAGLFGIAGCSGDDDDENRETPPPQTPTARPDTDPAPTPTISRSGDGRTTPSNTVDQPVDPWGDIDPTGDVAFGDDPNWRMLGHDFGNTFTNPHASGPSDDPSVRWSIERDLAPAISGHISHHPLIVDGTVYTTFQTESTQGRGGVEQWDFVAVDADSGEMETLFSVEGRLWKPTIVDDTVYVGVGATVRAYDLSTGEERWRSDASTESEPFLFKTSAIRYVDGVVVVTDNVNLQTPEGDPAPQHYGFDGDTGEMLWNAPGDGESPNNIRLPLIADGVSLYPETAAMRDIETGEIQVTLPEDLDFPTLHDGELYGRAKRDGEYVFVSYDWETLEERWTLRSDKGSGRGYPVAFDTVIIVPTSYGFVGVDRETGETRWYTEPSKGWEDDTALGSPLWPSTTETTYLVHSGGAVTALDPTDGAIKWQLRTDEMDWNFVSGCALADDLLLTVGVGGKLFAIS